MSGQRRAGLGLILARVNIANLWATGGPFNRLNAQPADDLQRFVASNPQLGRRQAIEHDGAVGQIRRVEPGANLGGKFQLIFNPA